MLVRLRFEITDDARLIVSVSAEDFLINLSFELFRVTSVLRDIDFFFLLRAKNEKSNNSLHHSLSLFVTRTLSFSNLDVFSRPTKIPFLTSVSTFFVERARRKKDDN